jgi:signal transduction histidine kinase
MKFLNNFLTSGHQFSEIDNLQRFRFSFLNSLLFIAAIFTLINYFASILNLVPFPPIYEKTLLCFSFTCFFSIYLLRKKKRNYFLAAYCVLISSLVLFYTALFIVLHDEFRLIWFFLNVFTSFILLGKKYGIIFMLLVLISIIFININFDLGFSKYAQFTFFNSFLIFTSFSYFFLAKIEKDALEFKQLNNKLKDKVIQEILQREQQEQMLLQQCRMASMGEMLDSIAHQWRQPLMHINAILLNMDNALEKKIHSENYLENKIEEVASLTTHMSQTIEDFRGLFKKEKEKTHFKISHAINDVVALMKNSLNDIDLHYEPSNGLSILGHRSELMQVIIILLGNSIEALNSRKIKDKKIFIETKTSKENTCITLEDNAGGITPENIKTIFDPYFTTKKQSGGTGLGLYIAKIIAEHKMAGDISFCNTKTGAKFTIIIKIKV